MAWLQERVKLDSRNSSKPPSSDVAGTSRPGQASERKRGAQPGHKETYRALLDEGEVDAVHDLRPPEVCECGGPVEPGRALRHQVTDLAQAVRAEVLGVRFSLGAISQAQGVVARALQAPVQQAAASCSGAAVLHMDETSWRRSGARCAGRTCCATSSASPAGPGQRAVPA